MAIYKLPFFANWYFNQSFYSSFEKYLDEHQESDFYPFSIKAETQQKINAQTSIGNLATKPIFNLIESSNNNSETGPYKQ